MKIETDSMSHLCKDKTIIFTNCKNHIPVCNKMIKSSKSESVQSVRYIHVILLVFCKIKENYHGHEAVFRL